MTRRAKWTASTAALVALLLGGAFFLRARRVGTGSFGLRESPVLEVPVPASGPAESAFPRTPLAPEQTREPAVASGPTTQERGADPTLGDLKVRVVDAWDRPVDGAVVRARRADVPDAKSIDRVIGEGVFHLPLGVPHRLEVMGHSCFEPVVREPVYADGGEVTVRLVSRCARISGQVVEAETGEVLPYAAVAYQAEGWRSGASGFPTEFDLLVPAGELRFAAGAPKRESVDRVFRLESGEWLRDLRIPLAKLVARNVVAGRVLDPEGGPVVGAKVTFGALGGVFTERASAWSVERLGETLANDSGSFSVSVPRGTGVLHVEAAGFEPSGSISFEVQDDREDVEIVLARGGRLRVRGVRADGSTVLPTEVAVRRGAEVMLRVRGGRLDRSVHRVNVTGSAKQHPVGRDSLVSEKPAVDGEGYLTIEGVPLGECVVEVKAGQLEGKEMVFLPVAESAVVEVRVTQPRDGK